MATKIIVYFPPCLHKYTEMHFPGFHTPPPPPQIAEWKEGDSLS